MSWFSWCWPNAALRAECFNLRRELGATELLLHDAQRGAELINAELKKWRDKCKKLEAENETLTAENDRVWHELNRLTDDVNKWKQAAEQPQTSTAAILETSETELDQLAREIYIHTTDMSGDLLSPVDAFEMANAFIKYRDRKREEADNNGPF